MSIKDGLLHWWDMDEGTGSIVEDKHGSNNGTITGASWTSDGNFGNVLDFGTNSDNHRITTGGITFGNELSIGLWMRRTANKSVLSLWGWSGDIDNKPHCYSRGDDGDNLGIFRSGSNLFETNDDPANQVNTWFFVVYTRDGTGNTHKIYVNGTESTLSEIASLTENFGTQSENMLIGARTDTGGGTPQTSQNWEGQLTRAFVYDRALTQSEVTTLHNSGEGVIYSELDNIPEVTTQSADNITDTGARLNAEITDLAGEESVDAYFQYREQGSGTWIDTSPTQEITEIGTYNETISGLTASTTYEFRAAVEWDSGAEETFGTTETFETLAEPTENFQLTIVSTNSPVKQGGTLEVVVDIENTGNDDGTQDVTLAFDTEGNIVDTVNVTVNEGQTERRTLTYSIPGAQTPDTYSIWVASDDDSETTTMVVEESTAEINLVEPTQGQEFKAFTVDFKWNVETDGDTGTVYLFINKPTDAPTSEATFSESITTAGFHEYDETIEDVGENLGGQNNNTWFVRFVPDED